MSRWFRFYDDAINDPKLLKLPDRMHRIWIGLLCIASKNDGQLPPMEDCALMLRMQPERMGEALVSLVGAGLLDRNGSTLSPHKWDARQYKSDVSTERVKRFRNGGETAPEQNRENRATETVEVRDEQALAAWDAYGLATNGKAYPRNRRGGWRFPSQWPPMHAI